MALYVNSNVSSLNTQRHLDGTGEALQARYGDRIRYHWQPNAGVSAARNTGMSIATGRYFALLDSDDLWHPEKTARQCEWLDAHPDFGLVLCDVVRVDGGRGTVIRANPER